jgi:hypothetical protein
MAQVIENINANARPAKLYYLYAFKRFPDYDMLLLV